MVKKVVLIALPIVALGGLIGWRIMAKAGNQQQLKTGMASRKAQSVEVAIAGPAVISSTITATGNFDSPFKVQLTPRVAGKINSLTVREGDSVTAGQVLVKIDPAQALAGYSQAQANLAQAQAKLAEAKIQLAPNTAGVKGQIDQQSAALRSARADLSQTQQTVNATTSSLASAVDDASAKVASMQDNLTTAKATLDKEHATRANLKVKADRAKELFDKGYIAQKDLEDASTALDVQDKQVLIAVANVSSANQALQTSKNQLAQAKTQLDIAKSKGKADIASAQAKVNQVQSALTVAQANKAMDPAYAENVRALQAAVSVAAAQVSQAKTLLDETDLRSSINGVVTARNADEGSLASPGTAVLVIQSLDWLYFIANIPVELQDKVKVGEDASIQVESLNSKVVHGTINSINPSADPQSRQIALRIKINNPDHSLSPGMFGKIVFTTDAKKVDVAVPKEAITLKGKQATIAVVGSDSKIQIRNVTTGITDGKIVEVKDGVSAGEKVVTLSYDPLKDGKEVKVGDGKSGGGKGGKGKKGKGGGGAPDAAAPADGGSSPMSGGNNAPAMNTPSDAPATNDPGQSGANSPDGNAAPGKRRHGKGPGAPGQAASDSGRTG